MPRFYLDVSIGDDFTRDDVGIDYESLAVAEYHAARSAVEIGHDVLPEGRAPKVSVRVRDADGFLLLTVDVAMTVRRTARALM